MIYLGIDLGIKGALAILGNSPDDIAAQVEPLPIVRARDGRPEYDLQALTGRIHACTVVAIGGLFAVVELLTSLPPKVAGKPMGGSITNYKRGLSVGLMQGILTALKVPYQLVVPRTWQALMLAGTPGTDTKQRSILAAQRLFPHVSTRDGTERPSDGMADALLLAEYARRIHAPRRLTFNASLPHTAEVAD